MANYTGNYQNMTGRPSFYMSWTHFLWSNQFKYNDDVFPVFSQATGFAQTNTDTFNSVLDFNSSVQKTFFPTSSGGNEIQYRLCDTNHTDNFKLVNEPNGLVFDYVFVLNHNLKSAGAVMSFKDSLDVTGIVNEGFEYDGFSLFKINSISNTSSVLTLKFDPKYTAYTDDIKIGSIIFAKKFTMPVTPHVNHSLTFLNASSTVNTSFMGNKFYNTPNLYGKGGAFRVHDNTDSKGVVKSGLRRYNISFDTLLNETTISGKSSLFPVNEAANINPSADGYMLDSDTIYTDYPNGIPQEEEGVTWKSNSFVGRVWSLTNGYTNPFIFLPNNDYESHNDQYSICKIKGDTFKADQVANGAYKIRLEVQEQT